MQCIDIAEMQHMLGAHLLEASLHPWIYTFSHTLAHPGMVVGIVERMSNGMLTNGTCSYGCHSCLYAE